MCLTEWRFTGLLYSMYSYLSAFNLRFWLTPPIMFFFLLSIKNYLHVICIDHQFPVNKRRSYLLASEIRTTEGWGDASAGELLCHASMRNQVGISWSWIHWLARLANHWALGLVSAPASKDTMEDNSGRHQHWHLGSTFTNKFVCACKNTGSHI